MVAGKCSATFKSFIRDENFIVHKTTLYESVESKFALIPFMKTSVLLGETLDSVSTVFNEIAQHPPHTLFAVCNWSIGHPR